LLGSRGAVGRRALWRVRYAVLSRCGSNRRLSGRVVSRFP